MALQSLSQLLLAAERGRRWCPSLCRLSPSPGLPGHPWVGEPLLFHDLFSTPLDEPLAPYRAGSPRSGSGEHACGSTKEFPALVQAGGEAGSCLPQGLSPLSGSVPRLLPVSSGEAAGQQQMGQSRFKVNAGGLLL